MHASPGRSSRPNNVGWVLCTELRALRLERPRHAAAASWRLLTRCTCPAPPLAPLPRRPAVTASQVPGGGGALALYLLPRCLLVNTLEVPIQYKQQVGRIGTRGQSRSVRLERPAGGGADHLHPPRHSRCPPIPAHPPARRPCRARSTSGSWRRAARARCAGPTRCARCACACGCRRRAGSGAAASSWTPRGTCSSRSGAAPAPHYCRHTVCVRGRGARFGASAASSHQGLGSCAAPCSDALAGAAAFGGTAPKPCSLILLCAAVLAPCRHRDRGATPLGLCLTPLLFVMLIGLCRAGTETGG